MVAEQDQGHFAGREVQQHAQRQSDEGQKADNAFVTRCQAFKVVLVFAEDGVHHRGDHLCDVL